MHPVDPIFAETELKIVLSKPAYLKDKSPEYASCGSNSAHYFKIDGVS